MNLPPSTTRLSKVRDRMLVASPHSSNIVASDRAYFATGTSPPHIKNVKISTVLSLAELRSKLFVGVYYPYDKYRHSPIPKFDVDRN